MTILLTKMIPEEFQHYLNYAIENFANEQIKAKNWEQEGAISKAADVYKNLLPEDTNTANNYLFTIRNEELNIGMVWLAKKEEQKGFIYDINIWQAHQGKGYGKIAMKQVEVIAKEIGMKMIGLHVFGHNKVARSLYEQLGYVETNIKMEKSL